jgi:hypothetical protein
MENMNVTHRPWLWLIPLLLVVAWLGARGLDADAFWVDEVRSVQRAGEVRYGGPLSPVEIWQRTAKISDQVPGYYIVLAGWGSLVGLTEFTGRAFSLLLGVLAVAWTYRLGRDLHSPLAGLGAAVALSSSTFYVIFLHEMRAYALLVCLTAMLIWLYWRIITGRRDKPTQIGLALCAAGMIYVHYFALVLIGALALYHLLFVPKNREWWRVVILLGSAGLLFLPWFITSFTVFQDADRIRTRQWVSFGLVETVEQILSGFSNGSIAFFVLIGTFSLQLRQRGVWLIWWLLAAALSLALVINLWMGFLSALRYILLLWIPLALLAGFGVAGLARVGLRPLLVLGVLFSVGLWNNLDPSVADAINLPIRYLPWRPLAAELQGRGQPGDVLTFLTLIEGDDWDGAHEDVVAHYLHGMPIEPTIIKSLPMLPDADYLRKGQDAVKDARRVWLSYDPTMRPWRTGMLQDRLAELGFAYCGNITDTSELYLDMYARAPGDTETGQFVFGGDDLAHQIQLDLLEPVPEMIKDKLPIAHSWRLGEAVPRHTYSVALHLEDFAGNLVAQSDYGLPAEAFGCIATALDVSHLSAGNYTLLAAVYAWETGKRLPATGEQTDEPGNRLRLGDFQIYQ